MYKFAIIGCGRIAAKHAENIIARGKLLAVCDIVTEKADTFAHRFNTRAYYSIDDLLEGEPELDVVSICTPNGFHAEHSIKSLQAGKHVLCEKPISMTVSEAKVLLQARDETGKKIEEAFMVITNPQWVAVLDMIESGQIGEVKSVAGHFSYNNQDPNNIRNIRETGGGGLMDIGCYLIFFARLVFGAEPKRVVSLVEEHPDTKTDILTSALLEFPTGHATFTCGTRITPYQRVQIVGTKGRIEVQIPVNAPPDHPCKVFFDDGTDLMGRAIQTIEFETSDQYTIQGDLFSQSIRESREPILPLEESIKNMAVIEAVFRSAKSGKWEAPKV